MSRGIDPYLSVPKKNIVGSILAIYFFISGIILVKSAAVTLGEFLAEKIVLLIRDTTSGVFAGWIATALLHSSGAFDSIVVAFVSDHPYVQRYELDLLAELKKKGLGRATLVSCSVASDTIRDLSDYVIAYDPEGVRELPDDLTPPVHVITGQLLGLFKSIQLGCKPDAPSESGVINRVVKGIKVYDPIRFRERGDFDIIAER